MLILLPSGVHFHNAMLIPPVKVVRFHKNNTKSVYFHNQCTLQALKGG